MCWAVAARRPRRSADDPDALAFKERCDRTRNRQPEQRCELLDASPQRQELLPELRLREIRYLQTDHGRRRRAEPSTRRRARDTEIGGDGQVPGPLDEIPESMVIALLPASGPWAECRVREFSRRALSFG